LYFIGNYEKRIANEICTTTDKTSTTATESPPLLLADRVDLRYYWSFNSLLRKKNIEYPQTGLPFHTINADTFSKLKRV
jgi:hypothetical protein